jgi:hypothetical protein
MLTPENTGCSQTACNIVNKTFLSLDGFAKMRQDMADSTYTAEQFAAELARVTDREIRNGKMLSRDAAEQYAYEVLDEHSEHRLGKKSQIVMDLLCRLYEMDPCGKVRRDVVLSTLEEVEEAYVVH